MARILPHIEESGIDEGGTIFAKTLRECGVADRRVRLFLVRATVIAGAARGPMPEILTALPWARPTTRA